MRKLFFIFLIISISNSGSYSQRRNLYFVAAHPFYDAEPFPAYLFKLDIENNSLDTIQRISAGKESIREVKYYAEQRKIIIVKDGWILTENTHKAIQFLDMNNPHKLDSIILDSLNYTYMNSWLLSKPSSSSYFFGVELYNYKLSKKQKLLGFDIEDLTKINFDIEDFKRAKLSGNGGSCLLTFDALPAYTNAKNGDLRIPETSDTSRRPIFPIQLPEEFQLKKKVRKKILINTNDSFIFSLFNSPVDKANIGYSDLAILDKSTNNWYKQRIKGNCDGMMRAFGNWMAGTTFSNNNLFDEKGRLKEKFERESPGKESRRLKMSKTGMPADYRFDYFGVYSPGILYLLNVQTRNYIEWNTGQGDSEILLVEKNIVYYRTSDEIYKAPILKKKLGNPQLLIKDEIVPDIHWAFLSK